MKSFFCNLKRFWLDLEGETRFKIITTGCIIVLLFMSLSSNLWSFPKEENYTVMEKIVYKISEEKQVKQKLLDQIINYTATFNNDGSISIKLNGRSLETVDATLLNDYTIKSTKRCNEIFGFIIFIIVAFVIAGFACTIVLYLIYFFIRFVYRIIRKKVFKL